ncbi:hypothetical protein ATCVMN08101_137R [Acanthocystis turfacea Chlorella virus MN0810.1]|nr:hypothetical protein ATCVMN08101_137R [Acanthocystis turfacea Chlorella virus MN0810.1]
MQTRRIFVTGGNGYIGSNIIKEYLANGWEATAWVRDAKRAGNIDVPGVTIVEGELTQHDKLFEAARGHDVVVHTADVDPAVAQDAMNVLISASIATATADKSRNVKFIFCSGCMVNGTDGEVRDESVFCDVPFEALRWKVPFEIYVDAFNGELPNFSTASIRPSWVYGLSAKNYTNDYLKFCKDNGRVPVTDDIKDDNHMAFVHILDVARCFYLVGSGKATGIVNAADNEFISAKDFFSALSEFLGAPIVDEYNSGYFPSFCAVSNQRIKTIRDKEIGWTRKYGSIIKELPRVFSELYN